MAGSAKQIERTLSYVPLHPPPTLSIGVAVGATEVAPGGQNEREGAQRFEGQYPDLGERVTGLAQ